MATHQLLLDIEGTTSDVTDLVASLQQPCQEMDEALRAYP
jgi:hypothetical protein